MEEEGNGMKIAVFVSGRGSNMEAILSSIECGYLQSQVVFVFSDHPESKALETAKKAGIPCACEKKPDADFLLRNLREAGADFIVLAGYLKLIPSKLVEVFENRIINIHPALLPKFGGKGYYGMNVHRAVLEEKREEESAFPMVSLSSTTIDRSQAVTKSVRMPYYTGATVHFIDREYDKGSILMQARVDISDLDTAEEIAARVLILEHKILVAAIKILETGMLK